MERYNILLETLYTTYLMVTEYMTAHMVSLHLFIITKNIIYGYNLKHKYASKHY
jgi:hypothetical protein